MQTPVAEIDYAHAIAAGNRAALVVLYKKMLPVIRRLVVELGNGTEADASDIFQDAVMIVYEKVNQPGFVLTSSFHTYFYGICRNLRLSKLKKRSGNEACMPEEVTLGESELFSDAAYLTMERLKLIENAMLKLGEDCRRLMQLHFLETPIPRIAEILGYNSEGYARRRKCQCKARLIELIKQDPAYRELIDY